MSDSEGKSSLHGNLTRERKDLDVFGKYQIGAHLGQGSMVSRASAGQSTVVVMTVSVPICEQPDAWNLTSLSRAGCLHSTPSLPRSPDSLERCRSDSFSHGGSLEIVCLLLSLLSLAYDHYDPTTPGRRFEGADTAGQNRRLRL